MHLPFFLFFKKKKTNHPGFYIQFCRAIAAALFDGFGGEVQFVPISADEDEEIAYEKLNTQDVDVVIGMTHTFRYDTAETTTGTGYAFSQPIYYDGLTFGGIDT